jgi:hypothetical protein
MTAAKDRLAIPELAAVPEVAEVVRRRAGFSARQDQVEARRVEVGAELARLRRRADTAALADRLRAGEAVDFARPEVAGLEREAEALATEAAALSAAIALEDQALAAATAQAADDLAARLGPHLAAIDRRAAEAFWAFVRVREERHTLARVLAAKGYSDLALDVGGAGLMAEMGSSTEPGAPMQLVVEHLAGRGLVKV